MLTIIHYLTASFLMLAMILMATSLYQAVKILWAPNYDPKDINLNYEITGRGAKRVLLLHGMAGTLDYWKKGGLEKYPGQRFIMVDLLGFGESPKPKSRYNYEEHLTAIEKIVIKEKLNDGFTQVVGHSMGALLALALVSRNPNWYGGATFISIPLFSDKTEINEHYQNGTRFEKISTGKFGLFFCMLHPIYFIEIFRPKELPKDIFYNARKHTWFSYDRSFKNIILGSNIIEYPNDIRDKKILFIHGDKDTSAPYAKAKDFSQNFKNSNFLTIRDGDHQVYLTNHKKIWTTIIGNFDD